MSTTDASHQEELKVLKALYDKVGLRGYWDIGRTASRPAPIEPKLWRWSDIYPALQRASEVVRIGEDAFRRANGMLTGSRTLNAGYQYVAPGESAGAHRHVASALRFVVQGHGGYTTSDGVQMVMEPGDLLTQPNWTWHDHNNFGNEPMIWLDGLDAKLVQYLDCNFHENWAEDATQPLIRSSEETQQRLTAVRSPSFKPPSGRRVPYHYKWADTLRSLEAEAAAGNADPYDGCTSDLMRRKLLPALYRFREYGWKGPASSSSGGLPPAGLGDEGFRALARKPWRGAWGRTPPTPGATTASFFRPSGPGLPKITGPWRPASRPWKRTTTSPAIGSFTWPCRPTPSGEHCRPGPGRPDHGPGLDPPGGGKALRPDLDSASALNNQMHRYFDESQIYRIDHYLGKETVQNLLIFRFANDIFEPLWHRNLVQSVQITVAESAGVGSRGDYYEQTGALRDMVQNHLTQLLTLTAMEVPVTFEAEAIRSEKAKVLRAITPVRPEDVVYGQYTRGWWTARRCRATGRSPGWPPIPPPKPLWP